MQRAFSNSHRACCGIAVCQRRERAGSPHRPPILDGLPAVQRDGAREASGEARGALGLKDVKIAWSTFNGPDAMNNALISDSIDIVAGGVPGLLTLWNRTKGTQNEVRGISALSSQPFLMNTRIATTSSRSPT